MTTSFPSDSRQEIDYLTVDSAPPLFSGPVPKWKGPSVLALFIGLALVMLWMVNTPTLSAIFSNHDLYFAPYEGRSSIAIRTFILAFYISFAAFANGTLKARVLFGIDLVVSFFIVCAVIDLSNAIMGAQLGVAFSIHSGVIISGLIGFAIFSIKLLERGAMPSPIKIERRADRLRGPIVRLIGTGLNAVLIAWVVNGLDLQQVDTLREYAILGGVGPGVFLVLPVFFLQLYILSIIDAATTKYKDFSPPISVIVPAFNEAYIITNTIQALDDAAARYKGSVEILIMDNNSTDETAEIALKALANCKASKGRVISVPQPGKSRALNVGLDAVTTEFMVRVDADTQVGPDNFERAMRYFSDPMVGVVGGMPIPPKGGFFGRARLLEVVVKHGFYNVAAGAISSIVGIPGMFTVYRTSHPRHLGGFVEGMNGEDTDISLRIGELGYRSVVDPRIRYISEVPANYTHMREQRMRWFRSVFHISSRCRELIYSDKLTLRGKIILPYMLVNSARRAMLVPLIIFGILEYTSGFDPHTPIVWQSILAVVIGVSAILAVMAAIVNRKPSAILALPEYLLFRILRAYFTLESMLSITIHQTRYSLDSPKLHTQKTYEPARIV